MSNAGEFLAWVNSFIGTMKGVNSGDVPCGECVGCCTSFKFILVRPTDTKAKSKIPRELLFPAPGLPKGFQIMGYDERGHCPMFVNGKCSIYEARPETCRQYDCRVLAATAASVTCEGSVIAERIKSWQFSYDDEQSEKVALAIKCTMSFLKEQGKNFPSGYIPRAEAQLAALAIRVHPVFLGDNHTKQSTQEKISSIVTTYPADT